MPTLLAIKSWKGTTRLASTWKEAKRAKKKTDKRSSKSGQLRSGVVFLLALSCATTISRLSLMHLNEYYISFWVLSSTLLLQSAGALWKLKRHLIRWNPLSTKNQTVWISFVFGNPMHFNTIVLRGMRIWFAWLVLHKKCHVCRLLSVRCVGIKSS